MSVTWRRLFVALLVAALPLQALQLAWARAGGPAHVHVSVLAGWNAHHHHEHAGGVGHHHHEADDPEAATAVWLDDGAAATADSGAAPQRLKRVVLDHDTVRSALPPLRAPGVAALAPEEAPPRFDSHVGAPPERPPRG